MDKKLPVIAIAIGAVVVSTLLQVFIQGRNVDQKAKRLLWVSLVAGVVALIALFTIILSR